jgi:ferric-dicitrate binding protein FerR (iron transport regulator)
MNKLDLIVNDITNEEIHPDRIEEAAARVRRNLFAPRTTSDRIRSCADFQALIPSYLSKTLSAGRALLLQDHTRECIACRHALDQARAGKVRTLARPQTPPSRTVPKAWAIAAMAVLTFGIAAIFLTQMLPGSRALAAVQTVSGILYAVSDEGSTPIFAGREIPAGQRVRTAKDSKAFVRLGDGSVVEMNERSEISVINAGRGTAIRLDRGDIIVKAAKQKSGTLDVVTADAIVKVKGTIFAVTRGVKGSRVTVVEGAVEVAQGSQTQVLKPGEQVTTNPALAKTNAADAVSWSRDSARYLALLGEFSVIQKGLEQMPGPGLRHDSKLLALVPRDAVLYAAIPNLGPAITEAERLFRERVQQSEVLRTWWEEQKDSAKLEEMIQKVRTLSEYIGDEIVLTVSGDWDGNYTSPMVLAEVKKAGLDSFLESEFRQIAGHGAKNLPQVVNLESPGDTGRNDGRFNRRERNSASKSTQNSMLFGVKNNVLAIAWSQEQMDKLAELLANPREPGTSGLIGQVKSAYERGVAYLLCVNMEHITRHTVEKNKKNNRAQVNTGFENMRYLTVERKDIGGRTENMARLAFAGRRAGMAGWLSTPAPMGTLDFVSPNATFAVSMVLKSPQWMLGELMGTLAAQNPSFQERLEKINREHNVHISPNLGEPMGGEITFAVDGPILPLPSWKIAVEVYSPDRMQWGIEQIIQAFNADSQCSDCKINLTKEQVGSRTFYTLSTDKFAYEVHYVYVDGYLVAGPSRSLLTRAIQNRDTGLVLSRSENFRSQLPHDGRVNFSALIYHNVASAIAPLADQIGSMGGTEAQRESIRNLIANSKAGLIYAYGEDDAITVATNGTFFGFDLDTFALPALVGKGMQTTMKGATKQ